MTNPFSDSAATADLAIEHGLHLIRCNLTGKILGEMHREALEAAIQLEEYNDPFLTGEELLDSMQLRFLIQNAKPSPHLVAHKNKDGFKFLRTSYPRDLFALLASRMVFHSITQRKMDDSTTAAQRKMQWLIECQEHFAANAEIEGFSAAVDMLIRLDAIHDVRNVFYQDAIKTKAIRLANTEFDYCILVDFLNEVEDAAFEALTRMKNPPKGNAMSLTAALAAMTPEQLDLYERDEEAKDEKRRATLARFAAQARQTGKSGTVKKRNISLDELADSLPPKIK